jgi:hypothetical protein
MPKSKVRKKVKEQHHHDQIVEHEEHAHLLKESPSWLAPAMVGAFLAGLIWIVIYYVTNTGYPIPKIGAWNMLIGFGFIGAGFTLATRWH